VQPTRPDQTRHFAEDYRELGELQNAPARERAPVIEGVREGRLRIEDIREIRKDVEQQTKSPAVNRSSAVCAS